MCGTRADARRPAAPPLRSAPSRCLGGAAAAGAAAPPPSLLAAAPAPGGGAGGAGQPLTESGGGGAAGCSLASAALSSQRFRRSGRTSSCGGREEGSLAGWGSAGEHQGAGVHGTWPDGICGARLGAHREWAPAASEGARGAPPRRGPAATPLAHLQAHVAAGRAGRQDGQAQVQRGGRPCAAAGRARATDTQRRCRRGGEDCGSRALQGGRLQRMQQEKGGRHCPGGRRGAPPKRRDPRAGECGAVWGQIADRVIKLCFVS